MKRVLRLCTLVVFPLWTNDLCAQQLYRLLTARGDTISSEEFTAAGEKFSTYAKVPAMDLYFSLAASGTGRERKFVLDAVRQGSPQKLDVILQGDSVTAVFTSGTETKALPAKPVKPGESLVVFMNFAFTFVAEQISGMAIAEDKPQNVQVLAIDSFEIQSWTVRRRAADMVELLAPNGQMLVFRFDGRRLRELSVPSQGVKLIPAK